MRRRQVELFLKRVLLEDVYLPWLHAASDATPDSQQEHLMSELATSRIHEDRPGGLFHSHSRMQYLVMLSAVVLVLAERGSGDMRGPLEDQSTIASTVDQTL